MTRTIWKYTIEFGVPGIPDTTVLTMPRGATVLTADMLCLQPEDPTEARRIEMWAEVPTPDDDPDDYEARTFIVRGTGHPLPPEPTRHVATVRETPFVWHLLEVLPAPTPARPLDRIDHNVVDQKKAIVRSHAARLPTASVWPLVKLLAAHRQEIPIVIASGSSWATELAAAVGLVDGEWQRFDEERDPVTADELILITEPGADIPTAFRGRTVHHLTVTA